jgi:hypothetical protein
MLSPGFGTEFETHRPYCLNPPAGLESFQVPQLVTIGFDDNAYSGWEGSNGQGGMKWALDLFRNKKNPEGTGDTRTFDGNPCRVSFYMTASYAEAGAVEKSFMVQKAWRQALVDGHEIGNHTYSHSDKLKRNPNKQIWEREIEECELFLNDPYTPVPANHAKDSAGGIGLDHQRIYGFRAPFLAYTDETFAAVQKEGFLYDCSIEEGWQGDQNGSNYCWPYTLDHGSPGDSLIWNWPGVDRPKPIGSYPGLWELPLHPVIVPPDDKCAQYGIPEGFRRKIKEKGIWFDEAGGKIVGVDYNLFFVFRLNKEETLAILKYTFDLHYTGNRSPFSLGAHSDIYSSKYPLNSPTSYRDRQWVIEQFVDYVLTKPDVRIVPAYRIVDWCRHPVPLNSRRMDVAAVSFQESLK